MAKLETAPDTVEIILTDKSLVYLLWALSKNRTLEEVVISGLKKYLSISSTMHELSLSLMEMGCTKEEVISLLSIFSSPIMAAKVANSVFGVGDRRGMNDLLHMKRK